MRCECCGQELPKTDDILAYNIWSNAQRQILQSIIKRGAAKTADLLEDVYGERPQYLKHSPHWETLRQQVFRIRERMEEHGLPWRLQSKNGTGYWLVNV